MTGPLNSSYAPGVFFVTDLKEGILRLSHCPRFDRQVMQDTGGRRFSASRRLLDQYPIMISKSMSYVSNVCHSQACYFQIQNEKVVNW